MWRLGYISFVIIALLAVLALTDGLVLMVSIVIVALAASIIPEVLGDLRYSKYRREWEVANSVESDSTN
jgi:hypothetical protein